MSKDSRWARAQRIGLAGVAGCTLVVGGAATGASAATEPPAAVSVAAASTTSDFAERLESKYIDPDRVFSTDVRWWLGEASHTDETLLEEIQALYDSGFRGVELAMQGDSAAPDATYAYGTEMWTHKWNLMMNKLLDLGMGVYLTSGTNWATSNVPGLDPTSQAAMQNLTLGTGTVNAGASMTLLPTPPANARRPGAKFVTAYAYKLVEGVAVDPDSFIDLAPLVSQGADAWTQNVNWTAPASGNYQVFAIWTQGTYQTSSPSAQPSYATNYFDVRGVEALKAFWEEHYLSDPALVEKFKHGDVQLFMDSLEIHPGGGSEFQAPVATAPQFTFWAEDMAEEFQARKGYDITPYLFLIRGVKSLVYDPYHSVGTTGVYRLDGEEERRQAIINDWLDVQTQLYMERMLTPLKEWLNSVGIKTRAQISYGKPIENSEPIMAVDYPEAENFNQYNQVDIFRLWTGGSKLENKVLSTETGAQMAPYNNTAQRDLEDAYSAYAAGFQRIVWHVWGAGYSYGNTQWPGHNPTGFRHFGTRHPSAADYDEFNAHLGRVQQLLQTGKSRTDIGFIHQNWTQGVRFGGGVGSDNTEMNWQLAHQGVYYRSTELQDNGYTYDYFSPKFLFDDDVTFDETTKTIEKAGYKALVLYQDWLDIDGAKRILDWAKKGLPVVILEDAGSRTPLNDGKGAELAAVMAELKTLSTVRTAEVVDMPAGGYFSADPGGYDDNVMEKLQELGVYPTTGYSKWNHQLLTQTRRDDAGNEYVYVYNYDDGSYHQFSHKESVRNEDHGTNIKTDIVKRGQFIPYVIDAWTGKVTELAGYRWEDGKTVVPIDLDYNNIELLAFEKVDSEKLHVVSTTADSTHAVADGVAVRATESGTVKTELSNGKQYEKAVTVPEAYDITDWDLTVESWRPNPTAGNLTRTETIDGVTTTNRKTSTVKTPINVELDTLTTWNNIPEIGNAVSGTGHYEATFTWDADSASGAYLDLGDTLESSMKVWINGQKVGGHISTNPTKAKKDVGGAGKPTIDDGTGQQVPLVGKDLYTGGVNWTKPIMDASPYLVDGENTIVIEYNSVLSNVQLSRGVIAEGLNQRGWWGNDQVYLEFGPRQAKILPFVDVRYDANAPELAVAVDPEMVFPPNNKWRTVTFDIDASDDSGEVEVALVDAKAEGHKADVEVVSDIEARVLVRNGAVYTFTFHATDPSGNTTTEKVTVRVGR
ncbi:hypothetical protein [Micromonospora globbae]|uniref:Alpha-L-rhamnosidase n=1 Tax=Micromonospora globbae TaxID=1894969 RepID=A0A420EQI7_9ACTN|nr:hypothetical protein [Micromonospora globbae]RKF22946.1 hypothetical protein D7I43_30670 [Micromonospora globbae]